MSDFPGNADHLLDLAGTVFNTSASEDDLIELNAILLADEVSRRCYLNYCLMHVALRMESRAHRAVKKAHQQIYIESDVLAPSEFIIENIEIPASPAHSFPASLRYGPLSYLSSGWPVAYLIATVIFGIGIIIGSFTYVSQPEQIAERLPTAANYSGITEPQIEFVGRITGMVDCKWADPSTKPVSGRVAMDQKIALASGLMEITYDTGAKAILQGPVTYEVESKNGGFLSIGKLTGKVEVETAKGFSVRTPTATVTDLGTEFGVEVDDEGNTTSRVFRGSVELWALSADGKVESIARVLQENESARVENKGNPDGSNRVIVFVPSAKPVEFVRKISKRASKPLDRFDVIAYWQFDGNNFLADSSGHGHTLVNCGTTQVDDTASFNGEAILSTIDSVDLTPYEKIRVSWSQKATSLISERVIWEQTSNYMYVDGAIITYLSDGQGNAGISMTEDRGRFNVDKYPVASDTWEHFTVEYDCAARYRVNVVRVFKDGTELVITTRNEGFAPDSFVNAMFHIGARDGRKTSFVGQIDNFKIEGEAGKK